MPDETSERAVFAADGGKGFVQHYAAFLFGMPEGDRFAIFLRREQYAFLRPMELVKLGEGGLRLSRWAHIRLTGKQPIRCCIRRRCSFGCQFGCSQGGARCPQQYDGSTISILLSRIGIMSG